VTLDETSNFRLFTDYEEVYALDKRSDARFWIGSHYGDAKCGLISPEETWFLAGGEGLTYFGFQKGFIELLREERLVISKNSRGRVKAHFDKKVMFIHSIRLESVDAVRVLVDPWSDQASTWLLNISDLQLTKLRDGPSLVDQPYQEEIDF
jgi:hypothetical protein